MGQYVLTLLVYGTGRSHPVCVWDSTFSPCLCMGQYVLTLSVYGTACSHPARVWDSMPSPCPCMGQYALTNPVYGTPSDANKTFFLCSVFFFVKKNFFLINFSN